MSACAGTWFHSNHQASLQGDVVPSAITKEVRQGYLVGLVTRLDSNLLSCSRLLLSCYCAKSLLRKRKEPYPSSNSPGKKVKRGRTSKFLVSSCICWASFQEDLARMLCCHRLLLCLILLPPLPTGLPTRTRTGQGDTAPCKLENIVDASSEKRQVWGAYRGNPAPKRSLLPLP